MEINGLSEDMLAWLESQLRATLEATQRVLAQLEAHRKSLKNGARSTLPTKAPLPLAGGPNPTLAPPETQGAPLQPDVPKTPVQPLAVLSANPRIVVPEAVATLSGDFGIAEIRRILKGQGYYFIPDGAIRRTLQEMVAEGELIVTSTNIGRGGNKYCRVNQEP
jgi:hypothetical protein